MNDRMLINMVSAAMLAAWTDICSDTKCHPLDIERRGSKLYFCPGHWATGVAVRLQAMIPLGYIIANGNGTRYRAWGQSGPEWVHDKGKALRFARREDAESLCQDDEDAWSIIPLNLADLMEQGTQTALDPRIPTRSANKLDAKFYGRVFKVKDDTEVPEDEWIVFLAKDNAFAAMLPRYRDTCLEMGADDEQIAAVDRMLERVKVWREANPDRLRVPDAKGEKLLDQMPDAPNKKPDGSPLDHDNILRLLILLNPLHGSLDKQTYDEKQQSEFDLDAEYEYNDITITARQERDLTQAVEILEGLKKQAIKFVDNEPENKRLRTMLHNVLIRQRRLCLQTETMLKNARKAEREIRDEISALLEGTKPQ